MNGEEAHQGSHRQRREPDVSGNWWYILLLNGLIYIIGALVGVGIGLLGNSIASLADTQTAVQFVETALNVTSVVIIGLIFLAPIAVHFDREYVRAVSSWTPTPFYYLVFLGPLGSLISLIYLYHRHNHVGTP